MKIPGFLSGGNAFNRSGDLPNQVLNLQVDSSIAELMQGIAKKQLNQSLEQDRHLLDILG